MAYVSEGPVDPYGSSGSSGGVFSTDPGGALSTDPEDIKRRALAGNNTIHIADTPNAQYGGMQDGAEVARQKWWDQMGSNDKQQSQVIGGMGYGNSQFANPTNTGTSENAKLAGNEASGANGNQQGAIGLAGSLASGRTPSAGAYQLQNSLNQASDFQTAMGRSGRGAASLATGGANAQANTANLQQNAYTQAGAIKAADMTAGRGLYGSLVGTAREQDTARLGQANEMGQFNAGAKDAQALGMGNAAVGFGQVANAQSGMDLSNYKAGMGSINAQNQANQAGQSWRLHNQEQATAQNYQANS